MLIRVDNSPYIIVAWFCAAEIQSINRLIHRPNPLLILCQCKSYHFIQVSDMASNARTAPAHIMRSPAAVSPSSQEPNSTSIKGFRISTQKLPILKAEPIEEMTKDLGIAPPEMIFGDNFVTIEHEKTGWKITFNAFDALDRVDKTGQSMLQVAYSGEWQKSRCGILVVVFLSRQIASADIPPYF